MLLCVVCAQSSHIRANTPYAHQLTFISYSQHCSFRHSISSHSSDTLHLKTLSTHSSHTTNIASRDTLLSSHSSHTLLLKTVSTHLSHSRTTASHYSQFTKTTFLRKTHPSNIWASITHHSYRGTLIQKPQFRLVRRRGRIAEDPCSIDKNVVNVWDHAPRVSQSVA